MIHILSLAASRLDWLAARPTTLNKMNTDTFLRFIEKHRLGGLVKEALWRKHGNTISVSVTKTDGYSNKPNFFASVKLNNVFGVENGDIGIGDLARLHKFVAKSSADEISLSLEKYPSGEVEALQVSADSFNFRFTTSCLDGFKAVPMAKPDSAWTTAIILDDYVKEKFPKAHSATGSGPAGLFTVVAPKRIGQLCIVFGHSEKRLCDKISMRVSCADGLDAIMRPVAFEALPLKRILRANPEFKDPVLYVSDSGYASIEFSDNDLSARYVLKEIEVEE